MKTKIDAFRQFQSPRCCSAVLQLLEDLLPQFRLVSFRSDVADEYERMWSECRTEIGRDEL